MLKTVLFIKGQNSTAATLFIALGIGYFVLCFAKKEEKRLKKIGNVIGVFIVCITCLMILGKAIAKAQLVYGHGIEMVAKSGQFKK